MIFFKIDFSKKSFRNTIRVSKGLGPDQDRHSVGPDLGPNCLQTTKVATSKEIVKKSDCFYLVFSCSICFGELHVADSLIFQETRSINTVVA